MKLALYQGAPTDGDIEGAFARIESVLAASRAMDVEMAVLPELFLPGYNRPDLHSALSQPQGGDWECRLSGLCRAAGVGLTLGWAERDGDRVFNAASCFGLIFLFDIFYKWKQKKTRTNLSNRYSPHGQLVSVGRLLRGSTNS